MKTKKPKPGRAGYSTTEESLRHRVTMETLCARFSTRFINISSQEWGTEVEKFLKEIGTFCQVDRSYLFLVDETGLTMSNTHEWCAEGIEPQIDTLKDILFDALPWAMTRLINREPLHITSIKDLPAIAHHEQQHWHHQGIKSLVTVPMHSKNQFIGFVGFDSVRREKKWLAEDVTLLGMSADVLANALVRKRSDEILHTANENLQANVEERTAQLREVNMKLKQEIIERKKVEKKWREREKRYREIFDDALVSIREEECAELIKAINTLKANGITDFRNYFHEHPEFLEKAQDMIRITAVNAATLKMYGAKTKEEFFGSLKRTLLPESLSVFADELIALAEGKEFFEGENINQTLQGERILILVKIAFPSLYGGRTTALVSSMDITDRRRAEDLLRESEVKYRMLFESANDALCIEKFGRFVDCNSKALEIFCCEKEDICGGSFDYFSPERQPDGASSREKGRAIRMMAEKGQPQFFEWKHKRLDGTLFDAEVSLNRVYTSGGTHLLAIIRDVTDRKQTEETLQRAFCEIDQLKRQLEKDYQYLQEEIKLEHNFHQIIGGSAVLKYVLFKVEQIAPTDTTVLILGETGVGKELFARALHERSSRNARPLVKVNCATLPQNLIESELFGHERGAFSGAHARQIGRFELADGSTIFLDEIGELPLELQAKLLRVIQDGEFERLGNPKTLKSNARIIAATNKNLEDEVTNGKFRQDLWYRLNIFPITVPPLRERKEDIPLLTDFFVKKYARKLSKSFIRIPKRQLQILEEYDWPGNIRELENIVERSVVIANGSELLFDLPRRIVTMTNNDRSLIAVERDYLLQVLEKTNWVIEGGKGASAVLGLKPSTLRAKLQKLGIVRP